ncbi:glycine oxidase ThiO [Sporosarcina sp. BP05]|uniref:glycine oxidase ThiO n=1 Tax=Sporosarcina sp. BP05 TaxID=2758726 RepID=UPI001648CC8D|nr:glycine oxidase ThiO [Sporosarcina sp. BP05]
MSQQVDIVVIGGGIIGCSIAYYLAKECLSVHLVERDKIAQGTTRAAGGMLGAHSEYLNDTFYSFARESQALYKEFKCEKDADIGYTTGGIVQFACSEEERIALSRWNNAAYLSAEQVREQIPNVAPPAFGAYLFKEDVHVHPEKACLAFCSAAKRLGATVSEQAQVDEITTLHDGYQIRIGASVITAKHVVIAGGTASAKLVPGLQMTAVKGQCMQLNMMGRHLPYTLFHKGCYVIPRPDGTLVIGATMEQGLTDLQITDAGNLTLNAIAERFIPGLSHLPVMNRWAGLRPKTVDELPYIGRVAGNKNLYIAAGHFRNGILLAPATACLIRDLIVGNQVNIERIKAFDPKRGIFHEANNRTERQSV